MKYSELMNKIYHGEEGSLALSFEDAQTFAKILIARGYAVLLTGGDIGDDVRIEWKYAGDIENLEYANRANVAFGAPGYVEDLANGNYDPDEE